MWVEEAIVIKSSGKDAPNQVAGPYILYQTGLTVVNVCEVQVWRCGEGMNGIEDVPSNFMSTLRRGRSLCPGLCASSVVSVWLNRSTV